MYMGSSHWKEYTVTSFPALAIVDTIEKTYFQGETQYEANHY